MNIYNAHFDISCQYVSSQQEGFIITEYPQPFDHFKRVCL